MRKIILIRTSLTIQILFFVWARWIDYTLSRNDYGNPAILGSLLPELLFFMLGIVNLVLLGVYGVSVLRYRLRPDIAVLSLAVALLIIGTFYVAITQWAVRN